MFREYLDDDIETGTPSAEDLVVFGMATAEFAASMMARSAAEQMSAIRWVLDDARRNPGVFVDHPHA